MIGVTYGNRPLGRVFNRLPDGARPGVYLTARHHAGETPGSWALDGLLRHVAADKRLYDPLVWWAVPFVDLDDVIAGSYGKDPFPHDCNRAYGPGGPRRPEASAIEPDLRRFKEAAKGMFFADLHAPGHGEQNSYVPLRGWDADSPINPIAEEFANRFQAAQPADLRSTVAHITPKPGGNSRYPGLCSNRWASEVLNVDAVCVEVSYQGNGRTYYTVGDYRRLGAALADTVAEWLLRPKGLAAR
jgi:predicted deacylase